MEISFVFFILIFIDNICGGLFVYKGDLGYVNIRNIRYNITKI